MVSNPTGGKDVCCECCVLLGRGLCDELITRPQKSYRLWCVVVCDLETSRICAPYIYDIRSLRVKVQPPLVNLELRLSLTDGVSSCSSVSGVCLLLLMHSDVTIENLELLTRV